MFVRQSGNALMANQSRRFLGDSSGGLMSDPTPISAGTWVTLAIGASTLGQVDFFVSWTSLAQSFIGNVPWQVGTPVIQDGLIVSDAAVPVLITSDTTVGTVAQAANAVSSQVQILHVWINGPTQPTVAAINTMIANATSPWVAAANDPIQFLTDTAGNLAGGAVAAAALPILAIGAVAVGALWLLKQFEGTRTYRKAVG